MDNIAHNFERLLRIAPATTSWNLSADNFVNEENFEDGAENMRDFAVGDFGNFENSTEDLRNFSGGDFGDFGNGSSPSFSSACERWRAGEPLVMGEAYPRPEEFARARTLDSYERLQVALVVGLVVVSVAGNMAVVAVVYFNRFLRSSVNCYLANLAVADLLITVACWPTLVNRLTAPLYLLGRPLCKITVFALGTCVNVSALTLAVVAGGRLYAVLFPLRALRSASRPFLVISLLWAASFILALPALYVRDTRLFQWDDLLEESCGDIFCTSFPSHTVFRYYKILLLVTMFFLPEMVMVVAYTVIIVRLYCVKRGPADEAAPGPQHPSASDHAHLCARRKVVKMTAAVVVVFTLCWSPLHALSLCSLLAEGSHHPLPVWFSTAEFWAYFLGYCNSALNPLLYCGCSEKFRVGLKALVLRRPRWPRQRRAVGSGHSWSPSTLLMRLTSSSLSSKSSARGVISRQTSNSLPAKTDSARSSRRASTRRGFFKGHSRNSESLSSNPPPELNNSGGVSINGEARDGKMNHANQTGKKDLNYVNREAKVGNVNLTNQNGKEEQMETKKGCEQEQAREGEQVGLEEEEKERNVGSPLLSLNHENHSGKKEKQKGRKEGNEQEQQGK